MGGGGGGIKAGGGWVEGRKEIKRPINICQTLKCKSLACVPVGTKSSVITFLRRERKISIVFLFMECFGLVWCDFVAKPEYVINIFIQPRSGSMSRELRH